MHKKIKIKDLTFWDKNPRRILPENFKKLKDSLQEDPEYLNARPLVINHKDGKYIVYGGNMRLKALTELGHEECPAYVFEDATDEIMIKRAFRDNFEYGEWDHTILGQNFTPKEILAMDLPNISNFFNFDKINFVAGNDEEAEKELKEDDIPPIDADSDLFVELGDIYQLGDHLLICGDSTSDDPCRVFKKEEKATMVFTDPPYGVSYKGTNNPNGKEWQVIKGDDLRGDALYDMLVGAFKNIHKLTVEAPAVYVCYASNNHIQFESALLESALLESALRVRQTLIWAKNMVLGHSDYHWAHEPILYCSKEKSAAIWNADRTKTTMLSRLPTEGDIEKLKKEDMIAILKEVYMTSSVLSVQKDPAKEYVHPTQKPIKLPEMCIRNSSHAGDIVFEPFCGSGSTLIACEKAGRKCRACELDPKYVQQIVKRFWKYTSGTVPVRCINRDFDLQGILLG